MNRVETLDEDALTKAIWKFQERTGGFGPGNDEKIVTDILRTYLGALSTPIAAGGGEAIERIAECIWQAEWKRAGNGGLRKVPWSEIAPTDQERFRFVAREVAALSTAGAAEPVDAFEICAKVAEGHADLVEEMRGVYPGDPHGALGRDANKMRKLAKAIRALRPAEEKRS